MRGMPLILLRQRRRKAAPAPTGPWYTAGGLIGAAHVVFAYAAKGAASYAASKVNLANPGTLDAADGVAYPTWAAETGWTFNGTTQYLDTGVSSVQLGRGTGCVVVRYAGFVQPSEGAIAALFGAYTAGGTYMDVKAIESLGVVLCGANLGDGGEGDMWPGASGVLGLSGGDLYFNGEVLIQVGDFAFTEDVPSLYLGAENVHGAAGNFAAVSILEAVGLDTAPNAATMAALCTAMAAI